MRTLARIHGIFTAEVNDLVDKLERPEAMLKLAIREMEVALAETTSAAAQAIASETLLVRQAEEHERQAARWQSRAVAAAAAGDDDRARRALAQRIHHERLSETIREHSERARQTSMRVRRQVDLLRLKLAEARRALASLIVRQKAAAARNALQGLCGSCSEPTGLARFERMREQVEWAEAQAEALDELDGGSTRSEEEAFDLEAERQRIEAELAAINAPKRDPV